MKVLTLAQSSVIGDARVSREALTLAGAGHEVVAVGRGVPVGGALPGVALLDAGRPVGLGSASTTSRPGDGAGARTARWSRRGLRWLLLPEHRERVESAWRGAAARLVAERVTDVDVVHAHDLNTLSLGVRLARDFGAELVYDAHELWSDRRLPGRPTPVRSRRWTTRETGMARRAATVVTVSEGIAEVLRHRGLTDVIVVRNTFPGLGAPPPALDAPVRGLVYAGRIGAGRDLGTVLAASGLPGGPHVVVVGPTDPAFAARLRLPAGVDLLSPRPVDDLDDLYRGVGAAVVPLEDSCLNHRLALPNKIFHAVRAGVPVVAADLPEMRRLVVSTGIGELYRPGDPGSLMAAAARVTAAPARYREAVRAAQSTLSWDVDAAALIAAFDRIDLRRAPR